MPTITAPALFETSTAADDVPPPPLAVAVIYDERPAYHAAMRLLADALTGHVNASDVRPRIWRFDELHFQPWRERALTESMQADLFVVATTGRNPIPGHLVEWLRQAFESQYGRDTVATVVYDAENDAHYFGALCELLVRHEADGANLYFRDQHSLAGACLR